MARSVAGLLVAGMSIAIAGQHAWCQTGSDSRSAAPPGVVANSPQRLAYEVTTVKPPGPNGYAGSLRVYIQGAYGIPVNSDGWVIGPDWIDGAKYVIQGKPPDAIRDAMQTMTPAERGTDMHLMMQSLLADRFKLKAHFETREMPVYTLTVAKGGSKLKENSDTGKGQAAVGRSSVRGIAVPVHVLADMLQSVPDIGRRVIIDKTGLSGTYDIALKWTPMDGATPAGALNGTAPSPDAEGVSLFTAIEEQLGLKLVASKEPGQVLIIDHIERPSEN